jgi:hypothetical protein
MSLTPGHGMARGPLVLAGRLRLVGNSKVPPEKWVVSM